MSIADSLAALQQAKTDIANAIVEKGGTVGEGDGMSDFATDIGTISGGTDPWYADYDDDITRFFFNLVDSERLDLRIVLVLKGTLVVNWGDGVVEEFTRSDTNYSNFDHVYSSVGKYIVSLKRKYDTTTCNIVRSGFKTPFVRSINDDTDACARTMAFFLERVYEGWPVSLGISGVSTPYVGTSSITKLHIAGERGTTFLSGIAVSSGKVFVNNDIRQYCYSALKEIDIPSDAVFSNNAFFACSNLKTIKIPSSSSITTIPTAAFRYCASLILSGLPSNIVHISAYAFECCYSLSSTFTFYGDIEDIGANAFSCNTTKNLVKKYKFINNTKVPTLSTGAFSNIRDDTVVVIPDLLYEEWISESNWVTYASHIIKESEDT